MRNGGRRRCKAVDKTTTTTLLQAHQKKKSPKLIVLDLDNTMWTPELYQLRGRRRSKQQQVPIAGKEIRLFPGALDILERKRSGDLQHVQLAVASRTKSVDWAHDLLDQFNIRELLDHVEIFPGGKQSHLTNIQRASGISYSDMLFFDDARDGKYGNCEPVAGMGVLCVHCPKGLTTNDIFETGLQRFHEWDGTPNTIVEWDGSVTTATVSTTVNGDRQTGQVKFVNHEKRYGFIRLEDRTTKDLFFHFSSLPSGSSVGEGDKLSFAVEQDPKNGKLRATNIDIHRGSSTTANTENTIKMPSFSMNMPFAALVANQYKTLETRNGTMFTSYAEGTHMLLHVGRRTYPDGDRHLEVMKSGGISDAEIANLKALPRGFGRGMAVAICEIGKTYETTVEKRSQPEVQRQVAAFGEDSGRMVTEIRRVEYLKRPVAVAAQGGVFQVQVDPKILPDGWNVSTNDKTAEKGNGETVVKNSASKTDRKPVYSISG